MAPQSRLQLAKSKILEYFDGLPNKILKPLQLAQILDAMRQDWNLAKGTRPADFIDFLTSHTHLHPHDLPFPNRRERRYAWRDVSFLEVLMTLKDNPYFCHLAAAQIHRLVAQGQQIIYVNQEQRPHFANPDLEQGRIDAAFQRKPRVSNNVIDYSGTQICLVNGMHTGQLGVVEQVAELAPYKPGRVRVTNLERTLVDLAVRPFYGGGAANVLGAYRLAKGRVSVERLLSILRNMNFVYPYHQVIGFYLDRAGYEPSELALFRRLPMEYDFYLENAMTDTEFDAGWRLQVPRALRAP